MLIVFSPKNFCAAYDQFTVYVHNQLTIVFLGLPLSVHNALVAPPNLSVSSVPCVTSVFQTYLYLHLKNPFGQSP